MMDVILSGLSRSFARIGTRPVLRQVPDQYHPGAVFCSVTDVDGPAVLSMSGTQDSPFAPLASLNEDADPALALRLLACDFVLAPAWASLLLPALTPSAILLASFGHDVEREPIRFVWFTRSARLGSRATLVRSRPL